MSPAAWTAFVAAGAVGAPMRYLIDGAVGDRTRGALPWGTLLVNVSGSLLLGFLTGLALYHGFPKTPKVVLGTGFCGAYTTFSTFTFETARLVEEGAIADAFRNALGTLSTCASPPPLGVALAGRCSTPPAVWFRRPTRSSDHAGRPCSSTRSVCVCTPDHSRAVTSSTAVAAPRAGRPTRRPVRK